MREPVTHLASRGPMKRMRVVTIAAMLTLGATLVPRGACLAERPLPSSASSTSAVESTGGDSASSAALLKRRTAELTAALQAYRESLERLLVIYEQALAKAVEKERTWQELYARGTISRREL